MAAEELYTALAGELKRWCVTLAGGDRAEGEDLCQETFLRAIQHGGDLAALNQNQWRAWCYKTAKNLWVDRCRKRRREVPSEDPDPDREAVEQDFTAPAVAQLIGRLPKEERGLFVLRYFEGYNAAELGELFGLPPGTVRSRLLSARRRLKLWLEKDP